jgi:predicted nucleic acid-binding protein
VIVFSNTTPLVALASVDALHLLPALFQRVHVAESVAAECRAGGPVIVPELSSFPWLELVPVPAPGVARSPLWELDAGERDTIELACARKADLVIIDEKLGRNHAEFLGLRITGTLGVLLKAKQSGLIPSFKATVEGMRARGIRYSPALVARLAASMGE